MLLSYFNILTSLSLIQPLVAVSHITMGKHSRLNSPEIMSVAKGLGVDIQNSFVSPDVSLYKQAILSLQMRKERVAIGAEPARKSLSKLIQQHCMKLPSFQSHYHNPKSWLYMFVQCIISQ
jgi:hypothetical protein